MKNDDLLMQIMMLDFAVQDSALFIDTHPCDKEAMNYFNEAATRLKAAKKEYQKQGHALVIEKLELTKTITYLHLGHG